MGMKEVGVEFTNGIWVRLPREGHVQLISATMSKKVEVYLLNHHKYDILNADWVRSEATLIFDPTVIADLMLRRKNNETMFGEARRLVSAFKAPK